MRNLLLFFLFFLILTGCKKLVEAPEKKCFIPYVDFVAQHVNPSTLEVNFTPVTTFNGTISSYKWDFGDGTTFNGPNPPAHKYPAPTANNNGHYNVKLTVANECGEGFWTQDVTVSSCLPDTKFSFRYINDSTVEFTNQTKTQGSTSYLWNFGDGTIGANNEATFNHVYKSDHPFVVSLKATNSCGENNYTDTIAVCRKPVASQTVTINACGVVNINASASLNGLKYQWNFGNGTILPASPSSSPTISYTYPNGGNYTIKLTVFNASGCDSATASNNVSIAAASSLGGNSDWSFTSDDLDFNFTRAEVSNATSYKWNFGDGVTVNTQNATHTYVNPGSYTITLSALNNCGATYEFSIPLNVPFYNELKNTPSTGFQQVLAFSPSLIYFLGTNGKVYKTDTAGNWSSPINLPSGLAFNSETKLYKDVNDNLWIYGKKEVAKLNSNGTSWTSYFSSTGFANSTTINSIAIDNNDVLWTIGDGKLRKDKSSISSPVNFSSLAYAPTTGKIWLTSLNSNNLYYVNQNSSQVNTVNTSGISNGSDDIKINSTGEIFVTSGTGILRVNSSGSTIANYNSGNTNGLLNGRPSTFDFDAQGNLWVVLSGELYKLSLANSGNIKKYSFNSDLSSLASISVLSLSTSDTDILLAKTSGNAAIKIR
ncbi:MAG TPA: PKD domain-containing protein [Flavisolibacter sp.]|jgi:PKD repeat protein|nr:PKD domain-containing protein [Flavisolibacter sp.]